MYKNGKTFYGFEISSSINLKTLYFVIYSYNSRFCKCSESLYNIYKRLPQEDIRYFPEEACMLENISLVEGGANDVIEKGPFPLPQSLVEEAYLNFRLPKEYKEFIKRL